MDIMQINAIEYGGAIAHVAAAQLFQILSSTENMDGVQAVNWFGGVPGDGAEGDILLLAEYVVTHGAGGERLWIWGGITSLIVEGMPDSKLYADVDLPRRFAFDMFAAVCLQAYQQLTGIQQAELARAAIDVQVIPPLKIEDSIFEPTGSLGELEKHSEQFLKDLAAADQAPAEPDQVEEEQPTTFTAAGAPPTVPATMSIGAAAPATGDANEEETTDQGQEAGNQAGADPDGSKEVRDGNADDGAGGQAAGNDGSVSETGEDAEAGKQVEKPADALSGQSDGGSDASSSTDEVKKPAQPKKRK